MPPPFDMISKRCKIQASVKKQLINRFRDVIVEGEVHRMAYFGVVPNQSGYRATEHEFKLAFLHRTTVIGVNDNIIPRTCFSVYPFTELLKITDDHPYFVDVIGLLTSVGEEKEYAREGKIVKMIVVELASKDLTMRRTLFGEYVDQMNHFLGSGYVEQPVVILQLAKIKVFRGQVGLQNVMHATKILFNPDIHEVLEFKKSMIEQGIHGTQPLFIANESKIVSLEDDFMRLTRICTIEDLQDNNEEGCFVVFGVIRAIVEE
ncbi:Replication protein A 70 kDa DNA-binding subunit A [Arachis hypogaea]|nr:Replication protein A 70 kDa DNA-binding subunit A [Arachis hypogaea]